MRSTMRPTSRAGKKRGAGRKRLTLVWILLAAASFWWYENFTLTVVKDQVFTEKTARPIRVVQLTDLHGAAFGRGNSRLVFAVERQRPDCILVTGDMFTSGDGEGRQRALELFSQLVEVAQGAVFSVAGEHDREGSYLARLEEIGVRVLDSQMESLSLGGTTVDIFGTNSVYFSPDRDPLSRLPSPDPSHLTLLLAHLPRLELYAGWGADITFSGDTHGGIVRLPWIGPLEYQGVWLPKFCYSGRYYDKGIFEREGRFQVVSSGLGSYPVPLRLFNRPEIRVVDILPAQ